MKFKFLIDLLKKQCQNFSFPNFSAQPQPQLDTIFAELLSSSDGQVNFPFKDLWRFSLSLNECTTFVSRSLFPFDCELKIVVATDAISNSAPVSLRPERLDTRHAPCFPRPEGPNSDDTLLAAACFAAAGCFGIP